MKDVYLKLKKQLDTISTGYPDTESKIEIEILQKLFTEEDAKLFVELSPLPEKSLDIAKRIKRDLNDTEIHLEEMAKKGLLFRIHKNNETSYVTPPFTMGIMEFQVDRMDEEFASMTEKYFESGFGKTLQSNPTVLKRTIQVNNKLVLEYPIVPYNDAIQIIDKQKKIAVADCVCRAMGKLNETGCNKPLEVCLSFGEVAEYWAESLAGRYIDKDEAKKILKQSDEAGLVVQVSNSQAPGSMCACCSCCCIMLRSLKMQPNPAESSSSNYFAENNSEECSGCEECLERCQMEAIEIKDGKAAVIKERCIGCGLCVTTCSSESLRLIQKQEDKLYIPSATDFEMYMNIFKERCKL
ncbi:4Fe-4S binding protein [Desulfobacterales bacterium HSG17]|nr:4Fe-4S binding protein [Desulfobacterales bacterium HSG17]